MKPVKDIIKALELCTADLDEDSSCDGCPYDREDESAECIEEMEADALQALKIGYSEYREDSNENTTD